MSKKNNPISDRVNACVDWHGFRTFFTEELIGLCQHNHSITPAFCDLWTLRESVGVKVKKRFFTLQLTTDPCRSNECGAIVTESDDLESIKKNVGKNAPSYVESIALVTDRSKDPIGLVVIATNQSGESDLLRDFREAASSVAKVLDKLLFSDNLVNELSQLQLELALAEDWSESKATLETTLVEVIDKGCKYFTSSDTASWLIWASERVKDKIAFDHVFQPNARGSKELFFYESPEMVPTSVSGIALSESEVEYLVIHDFAGNNITTVSPGKISEMPKCVVAARVKIASTVHGVIGAFSNHHDIDVPAFGAFLARIASVLALCLHRRIQYNRFSESGINHDFFQGLASLDQSIQKIAETQLKSQLWEAFAFIGNLSSAYFRRPQSLHCYPRMTLCNVSNAINRAVRFAELRNGHQESVVTIENKLDNKTKVPIDESAFVAIVFNLVKNAIDHGYRATAADPDKVVVRCWRERDCLVVETDSQGLEDEIALSQDAFDDFCTFGYYRKLQTLWPKSGSNEYVRHGLRLCTRLLTQLRNAEQPEQSATLTLGSSRHTTGTCFRLCVPVK